MRCACQLLWLSQPTDLGSALYGDLGESTIGPERTQDPRKRSSPSPGRTIRQREGSTNQIGLPSPYLSSPLVVLVTDAAGATLRTASASISR